MILGVDIVFICLKLLRQILGIIDGYIYTAAAEIYGLMLDIASAEVFTKTMIDEMAGRVYQLLGLVMLFKLIFSFLTYVINPEAMNDKSKGFGNILKKIVISLGLIIITPWAFTQSRNLQTYIIQDGLIEYFVHGTANIDSIDPGYNLMFTTAKLFITPYQCASDIEGGCIKCATDNILQPPDKTGKPCKICDGEKADWEKHVTTSGEAGRCAFGSTSDAEGHNITAYGEQLIRAVTPAPTNRGQGYDLIALMGLSGYGENSQFYVELRYPLIGTTLVGIAIGYMLIVMCIDIAVRSVKLSFYEIIAPIPIMSYIGFKDGKDAMISKWFSQVLKTYADLFTRVLALQFSVAFIGMLIKNGVSQNSFFVTLFLIIGALTFAKQLPNILKDIGINFEGGGFSLKKKLRDDMAGGRALNAAAGAAGGLAANAAHKVGAVGKRTFGFAKDLKNGKSLKDSYKDNSLFAKRLANAGRAYKQSKASGNNFLKSAFSASKANTQFTRDHASEKGGNLVAGALSGARSGLKEEKLDFGAITKGAKSANAGRIERDNALEQGATGAGRTISGIQQSVGIKTAAQRADARFKAREDLQKSVDSVETEMDKEARKHNVNIGTFSFNGTTLGNEAQHQDYGTIMSAIETARSAGRTSVRLRDSSGSFISVPDSEFAHLEKELKKTIFDKMAGGSATSGSTGAAYTVEAKTNAMLTQLDSQLEYAERSGSMNDMSGRAIAGTAHGTDYKSKVDAIKSANTGTYIDKSTDSYRRAVANDANAKKDDKK